MAASAFEDVKTLVEKLLGLLETPAKDFYYQDENLRELKDRLKRLRPVITRFDSACNKSEHPAGEWLQNLHHELQAAEQLLLSIEGPFQLWQISGKFKKVNEKLSKLVEETPVVQSASSTSTCGHQVEEVHLTFRVGGEAVNDDVREVVNDVIEALGDVREVLPEETHSGTNKHLLEISRQLAKSYLL